jgi:hypothetical protein
MTLKTKALTLAIIALSFVPHWAGAAIDYNCTGSGEVPGLVEFEATQSSWAFSTSDKAINLARLNRGDIPMDTTNNYSCGKVYNSSTLDTVNFPAASTYRPVMVKIIDAANFAVPNRDPNSVYLKGTQDTPADRYNSLKKIENGPCEMKDGSETYYFWKVCFQNKV